MSEPTEPAADPSEKVPKLPRGRGFKFSPPELFRIAMTLVVLVAVIVMARPCARSVSGFVMSLDGSGSAKTKGTEVGKPGTVDVPPPAREQQYEQLRPGMSEAEIKAAIERSKARAAGSGSAAVHSP